MEHSVDKYSYQPGDLVVRQLRSVHQQLCVQNTDFVDLFLSHAAGVGVSVPSDPVIDVAATLNLVSPSDPRVARIKAHGWPVVLHSALTCIVSQLKCLTGCTRATIASRYSTPVVIATFHTPASSLAPAADLHIAVHVALPHSLFAPWAAVGSERSAADGLYTHCVMTAASLSSTTAHIRRVLRCRAPGWVSRGSSGEASKRGGGASHATSPTGESSVGLAAAHLLAAICAAHDVALSPFDCAALVAAVCEGKSKVSSSPSSPPLPTPPQLPSGAGSDSMVASQLRSRCVAGIVCELVGLEGAGGAAAVEAESGGKGRAVAAVAEYSSDDDVDDFAAHGRGGGDHEGSSRDFVAPPAPPSRAVPLTVVVSVVVTALTYAATPHRVDSVRVGASLLASACAISPLCVAIAQRELAEAAAAAAVTPSVRALTPFGLPSHTGGGAEGSLVGSGATAGGDILFSSPLSPTGGSSGVDGVVGGDGGWGGGASAQHVAIVAEQISTLGGEGAGSAGGAGVEGSAVKVSSVAGGVRGLLGGALAVGGGPSKRSIAAGVAPTGGGAHGAESLFVSAERDVLPLQMAALARFSAEELRGLYRSTWRCPSWLTGDAHMGGGLGGRGSEGEGTAAHSQGVRGGALTDSGASPPKTVNVALHARLARRADDAGVVKGHDTLAAVLGCLQQVALSRPYHTAVPSGGAGGVGGGSGGATTAQKGVVVVVPTAGRAAPSQVRADLFRLALLVVSWKAASAPVSVYVTTSTDPATRSPSVLLGDGAERVSGRWWGCERAVEESVGGGVVSFSAGSAGEGGVAEAGGSVGKKKKGKKGAGVPTGGAEGGAVKGGRGVRDRSRSPSAGRRSGAAGVTQGGGFDVTRAIMSPTHPPTSLASSLLRWCSAVDVSVEVECGGVMAVSGDAAASQSGVRSDSAANTEAAKVGNAEWRRAADRSVSAAVAAAGLRAALFHSISRWFASCTVSVLGFRTDAAGSAERVTVSLRICFALHSAYADATIVRGPPAAATEAEVSVFTQMFEGVSEVRRFADGSLQHAAVLGSARHIDCLSTAVAHCAAFALRGLRVDGVVATAASSSATAAGGGAGAHFLSGASSRGVELSHEGANAHRGRSTGPRRPRVVCAAIATPPVPPAALDAMAKWCGCSVPPAIPAARCAIAVAGETAASGRGGVRDGGSAFTQRRGSAGATAAAKGGASAASSSSAPSSSPAGAVAAVVDVVPAAVSTALGTLGGVDDELRAVRRAFGTLSAAVDAVAPPPISVNAAPGTQGAQGSSGVGERYVKRGFPVRVRAMKVASSEWAGTAAVPLRPHVCLCRANPRSVGVEGSVKGGSGVVAVAAGAPMMPRVGGATDAAGCIRRWEACACVGVRPINVVVEVEDGPRWPHTASAIRATKTALCVRLAKCLRKRKVITSAVAFKDSTVVVVGGFAFALHLFVQRDIRALASSPGGAAAANMFTEAVIVRPQHVDYIRAVSAAYTSFALCVRAVKRWCDAQLTWPAVSTTIIELICAAVYTACDALAPATATAGFLRVLSYMSAVLTPISFSQATPSHAGVGSGLEGMSSGGSSVQITSVYPIIALPIPAAAPPERSVVDGRGRLARKRSRRDVAVAHDAMVVKRLVTTAAAGWRTLNDSAGMGGVMDRLSSSSAVAGGGVGGVPTAGGVVRVDGCVLLTAPYSPGGVSSRPPLVGVRRLRALAGAAVRHVATKLCVADAGVAASVALTSTTPPTEGAVVPLSSTWKLPAPTSAQLALCVDTSTIRAVAGGKSDRDAGARASGLGRKGEADGGEANKMKGIKQRPTAQAFFSASRDPDSVLPSLVGGGAAQSTSTVVWGPIFRSDPSVFPLRFEGDEGAAAGFESAALTPWCAGVDGHPRSQTELVTAITTAATAATTAVRLRSQPSSFLREKLAPAPAQSGTGRVASARTRTAAKSAKAARSRGAKAADGEESDASDMAAGGAADGAVDEDYARWLAGVVEFEPFVSAVERLSQSTAPNCVWGASLYSPKALAGVTFTPAATAKLAAGGVAGGTAYAALAEKIADATDGVFIPKVVPSAAPASVSLSVAAGGSSVSASASVSAGPSGGAAASASKRGTGGKGRQGRGGAGSAKRRK